MRQIPAHPHSASFRPLTLDEAFENYLIAKRDHENERYLAAQNYGGWNFTASTANKLRFAEDDLLRRFNR